MKSKIRVIIADAQMLIRIGLNKIISEVNHIECIDEAENAEKLLCSLEKNEADIIIIDYAQPNHFNVDIIQTIKKKYPNTEFLVISTDNNKETILKSINDGVKGFLTKECDDEEIINAIEAIIQINR